MPTFFSIKRVAKQQPFKKRDVSQLKTNELTEKDDENQSSDSNSKYAAFSQAGKSKM